MKTINEESIDRLNWKNPVQLNNGSLSVGSRHYDFSQNNWQNFDVPFPNISELPDEIAREAARYTGLEPDDFGEELGRNFDEEFRERLYEGTQLSPMMNYAWPLPDYDGDLQKDQLAVAWNCNCCLVELDGETEPVIAMTAAGTDLSWDLAEAYVRCGYYPPLNLQPLARSTQFVADIELIEKDYQEYTTKQWVYVACLLGVETLINQVRRTEDNMLDYFADDEFKTKLNDSDYNFRSKFF